MALEKRELKTLVFDLDDTLFDTLGLLVKPATAEACKAMIEKGLNTGLEECLKRREELFTGKPRQNVYAELVKHFGVRDGADPEAVAKAGFDAFHDREIKEAIKTFPEVPALLSDLGEKYELILVTMGSPATQKKKVELLKLGELFDFVVYVNVAREKSKARAFEEILRRRPADPRSFVSIGNRIDGDIRDAKKLGMQTILMAHGEYLHLKPQDEFEMPDATVNDITELRGLLV